MRTFRLIIVAISLALIAVYCRAVRDLFLEPVAAPESSLIAPPTGIPEPRPLKEWVAPETVLTPPTEISKVLVERFGL